MILLHISVDDNRKHLNIVTVPLDISIRIYNLNIRILLVTKLY